MKPVGRVLGAALVAAPLLLITATALFAADGSFYDSQAAGSVQFVAMAVMAIAVAGLTRIIEPTLPRLAALSAVVGHLGVAAGAGFGIERIYTSLGSPALDAAGAPVPLYPLGLLFPLGFVLFGLGLARARDAEWPRWAGYAMALGGVLFPVSRIGGSPSLGLAADALLATGLVAIGVWVLNLRSNRLGAEALAAA